MTEGRTMSEEWRRGDVTISTDPSRIDVGAVHAFLAESYWARGIPIDVVRRSIEGSFPFGLYRGGRQIGFARVITDFATFAYLADVYVLPEARGGGLGKWLVETIVAHPRLQGLRRWVLLTKDAHELYRRYGFHEPQQPARYMEIRSADVSLRKRGSSPGGGEGGA
jgi:GNAT superfamily N-acetyltransferase